VLERRLGLIERSYFVGTKTVEILASQLAVYSVFVFLQVALILILLLAVFPVGKIDFVFLGKILYRK
jgi:hypothetical protein